MHAQRLLAAVVAGLLAAAQAAAAPSAELQNLKWFVVNGIGQGEGLAHYQDVIDRAMADAKLLLQGDQGPADVPCCLDVRRVSIATANVVTLQAVDSAADYLDMTTICNNAGGGSCAFLVDTVSYCDGPAPGAIGCADAPLCAENLPDDDPTLTLVVSLDALDQGVLAQTIAHERGHNACLEHVPSAENPADESCALMQPAVGGGCLAGAECSHYRDAGNATGGRCRCHTDALETAIDGKACRDDALVGLCSAGVCGEVGSDASVRLLAAGAPELPAPGATDDALVVSGLAGGWRDAGDFTAAVNDLEHAASRGVVFAVTAADQLLRVDPATGATLATVGALPATGFGDLTGVAVRYDGIAFDPGPSASLADDRLYAVQQAESCDDQDFCASVLVSVDPDDAVASFLGDLDTTFFDGVNGLAWDTARGRLYATASALGTLFEIDPACGGALQFCSVLDVVEVQLPRLRSSLAYADATDRLYLVGTLAGDVVFYDSIDAASFAVAGESIGIDAFRPGGLAALPAPEPGAPAAALAALAALAARRRA